MASKHPVGVGPFRLVDHQPDQSYTIERNPDYWGSGKPYLERITWKIIPLDATRLVELRSGGVHIAEDLPLQNVEQIRGMDQVVLSERPGARFYFNRWNMDDEYGKSLELRQAYNWILDREANYKAVFFNTGLIGFDPFLPGQPFYDANYKPFTRDVAKAKALMDTAALPTVSSPSIQTPARLARSSPRSCRPPLPSSGSRSTSRTRTSPRRRRARSAATG